MAGDDTKNNGCICKYHYGFKSDIATNKETNKSQWHEINSIKKFIMITLLMVCLTLAGVIAQITITLAK